MRRVRFGVFEADLENGELRKSGIRIKLQEQPFQILALLIAHCGEVVTREELRQRLWPQDTFVDFDHGLNAAVNKLREALGDAASGARYIETVPRRGYRFVAPVEPTLHSAQAAPERVKSRSSILVLCVLAAVAVAAVGTIYLGLRWRPADLTLTAVPLTSDPGSELQPSLSPDGNYVVFVGRPLDTKDYDLFVKQIGSEKLLRLTSEAAPDFSPSWSRDGRWIAFVRMLSSEEGAILVIPALGGAARRVASIRIHSMGIGARRFINWSTDSENLVVADGDGQTWSLYLVAIRSGARVRLTEPPAGFQGDGDFDPAVSPDGRALAFSRYRLGLAELCLVGLGSDHRPSGQVRQITEAGVVSTSPAWTPDGKNLVYRSGPQHTGSLWRIRAAGGAPARRLALEATGITIVPSISTLKTKLVYSTSRIDVNIWRTAASSSIGSKAPTLLIGSTYLDHLPAFSPDGSRLAFISGRSGSREVWISDADGANPVQLTSVKPAEADHPRWSPDGRHIAFDSAASIHAIAIDGHTPEVVVRDAAAKAPHWSPDGKWLYFCSVRTGRGEVWRIAMRGTKPAGEPVQLTRGGGLDPVPSPDGDYVYYARRMRPSELWRVPAAGGHEERVLEDLSNSGTFTVTPAGVYFIPTPDATGRSSIRFLDLKTGQQRIIGSVEKTPMWGLSASPDGKWVVHSQWDDFGADLMLVENFR